MPRDLFFFSWGNAYVLFLLIPLILLLFYGALKKKEAVFKLIGRHAALLKGGSTHLLRPALLVAGLFFSGLALMQPMGNLKSASAGKVSAPLELYLLIDSSLSMGVKDAVNGISRFDRAKEIAGKLILELKGEQISLNLFSDRLQTIVPLTYDELFLRLSLRGVYLNEGGFAGTKFEPVLNQLKKQLERRTFAGNSVVLFLSDGGDTSLEDAMGQTKKQMIEEIVKSAPDVPLNAVLLGSERGGPIPDITRGGVQVESKAEADLLQALSGRHFYLDSEDIIDRLSEAFRSEKKNYMEHASKSWSATPYFQVPLGLALLCFLLANPWHRLRFFLFFLAASSLNAEELWLQDRKLYNSAVQALDEKGYEEALISLEGISPTAYGSPIFRSRIAINYGEASLGRALEIGDPYLLEQALFIVRLFKLLPCEPASLCYPELVGLVEGKLQTALGTMTRNWSQQLDPYPYIHFAAMMPSQDIIKHVSYITEEAASAKTTKELLEVALSDLQKQKNGTEEESLRILLRSAVDVSFLVLLGGDSGVISALQKQFKSTLSEIEALQKNRFEQGVCQCAPWSEVIPLLAAGGGYIDAITPEMGTQERFNYSNEAVKKFRAAFLKLKSGKANKEKSREAANELSEMEQLDEKKVQPKLDQSAEGKPW